MWNIFNRSKQESLNNSLYGWDDKEGESSDSPTIESYEEKRLREESEARKHREEKKLRKENSTMASGLKPPKGFVPSANPSLEWTRWLKRFDNYATAVELEKKSEEIQAATFQTVIGAENEAILETLNVSEDEFKSIAALKKKLTDYFAPKTNTFYERYLFNKLHQSERGTVQRVFTKSKNASETR